MDAKKIVADYTRLACVYVCGIVRTTSAPIGGRVIIGLCEMSYGRSFGKNAVSLGVNDDVPTLL